MLIGICITPPNLKRYVIEPKRFFGYPERGNACTIPMHEQYPFDSLDQNNLADVDRDMHYPSKFEKICYRTQMIFWIP
jgi:hypothetical protein